MIQARRFERLDDDLGPVAAAAVAWDDVDEFAGHGRAPRVATQPPTRPSPGPVIPSP
jgi:hypothetical protein